jgi:hypothetical protein
MDFTVGLLALAVGLAFDFQRLIPSIGDRVAAACALVVGAAWLSGGQLGEWLRSAVSAVASTVAAAAHSLIGDVPAGSGPIIAGIVVGFLFLLWLLAMLPNFGLLTKHLSPNVSNELSSGLIWTGVIFPPLIGLVPGWWGDISTQITVAGANLGRDLVGLVLS